MKVPAQENFQVMPAIAPAGQLATPRMENVAARQAESFGRSMQGVGVQMSRMAMHMQEEANQLRLARRAAEAEGVRLNLLSDYDLTGARHQTGTLVLGYGSLDDAACASVGQTLKRVCTEAREASVNP